MPEARTVRFYGHIPFFLCVGFVHAFLYVHVYVCVDVRLTY